MQTKSRMKKIEKDKWKHFYVGIIMGIVLQAFLFFLLDDDRLTAGIIAFVLVVIISYGFELFSKFSGLGHYDIADAIAGIIGGIVGMAIVFVIQMFI